MWFDVKCEGKRASYCRYLVFSCDVTSIILIDTNFFASKRSPPLSRPPFILST